jgi:transcriptional regulator with XRE-family HTH domain
MPANRPNLKAPMTAAQLRAARALLGWSARELASRCGVSHSAISRAERVSDTPQLQARSLNAIRATLEKHGIEFLATNGVRLLSNQK